MAYSLENQTGVTLLSLWHKHFGETSPESSAQLSRGTVNAATHSSSNPQSERVDYEKNKPYVEVKRPMITADISSQKEDFIATTMAASMAYTPVATGGDAAASIDSYADYQAATAKSAPKAEHKPVATPQLYTQGDSKTSVTNSDAPANASLETLMAAMATVRIEPRDSAGTTFGGA